MVQFIFQITISEAAEGDAATDPEGHDVATDPGAHRPELSTDLEEDYEGFLDEWLGDFTDSDDPEDAAEADGIANERPVLFTNSRVQCFMMFAVICSSCTVSLQRFSFSSRPVSRRCLKKDAWVFNVQGAVAILAQG